MKEGEPLNLCGLRGFVVISIVASPVTGGFAGFAKPLRPLR